MHLDDNIIKNKIDLPIKEHKFKAIINILADSRSDANNILEHLNSKSVTIDVMPGFDEGESGYDPEQKI